MTDRTRLAALIAVTAATAIVVALLALYTLYVEEYEWNRRVMTDLVSGHAGLLVHLLDPYELSGLTDQEFSQLEDIDVLQRTLTSLVHLSLGKVTDDGIEMLALPARRSRLLPLAARELGIVRRALEEGPDTMQLESADGGDLLVAFAPIGRTGFVLLGSRQLSELRHPYQVIGLVVILVSLLMTSGSAILSARIGRRLLGEVERSERKFRTLFEASTEGMALLTDRFVECNAAFLRMLGRTEQEVIGRTLDEFSLPLQPDGRSSGEMAQRMMEAARNGQPQRFEWKCCRSDGVAIDVDISIEAVELGGKHYLYATARDISDRKSTERALLLTQFAIDEAMDPVLFLRRDGTVVYANRNTFRLLGHSRDQLVGMHLRDFDEHYTESAWEDLFRKLNERHSVETQSEWRTGDGDAIPVEVRASLLEFERSAYCCAFVRDLREHRHLQAQLLQAQKLEAVGRLAGGVAHDFNNLLMVIRGYTELLLSETDLPESHRTQLVEIDSAANRAVDLTRQLLTFSRKQIVEPKIVNLNELVADMEPLIRRLIGEDIAFLTFFQPELGRIRIDPAQLQQVIMNLCVNARDAMPHGGKLVVETHDTYLDETYAESKPGVRTGEYVFLSVSDNGIGMDKRTADKAFEPFFTTKGRDKGTGLGLSTAYGIVKKAGGNIWVYSEPGKGTTFKVYLPREDSAQAEPASAKVDETALGGTETILLVEDDPNVRALVAGILRDLGYTVLVCSSPSDAIRTLEAYGYEIHLLLTDVVLPEMNGRVLAGRLQGMRTDLRVLFISGYTDNMVFAEGVLEEGVSFLQKPFTRRSLALKLREILDPPLAEI